MTATLSILGLYNYDDTIFDNIELPDGVDSATAVDAILYDCAELEIIYPDPECMKKLISVWSKRELPVWERIYKAVNMEYNPIENYNRTERWTDNDRGQASGVSNSSNTNKVTGYNSNSFVDRDMSTGNASSSSSSVVSSTHSGNISGNIGVTTSQQMLNQELDVAERTDIYSYIVQSFKNRFCLLVY